MEKLLFWVYLTNAILLINHEIDSGYWQEWKLFKPNEKNGIDGFLLLHFPLLFIILYGLVQVDNGAKFGLWVSLFLGVCGVFAFFFHFYHLRKGRPEFDTILSKSILIATFFISLVQISITLCLF